LKKKYLEKWILETQNGRRHQFLKNYYYGLTEEVRMLEAILNHSRSLLIPGKLSKVLFNCQSSSVLATLSIKALNHALITFSTGSFSTQFTEYTHSE